MRFLHIKRAYVLDSTHVFEVERDAALNISLLDRVYPGENKHDICAVTEEGEWLVHGRKIDSTTALQHYDISFVYIHSPSDVYDRVFHSCKAHAQKYVLIYKATDALLHHSARLEALIKTNALKAKVAHQIHVDMQGYNEDYTSSEVVAGTHIRNVFLPVEVLSSTYRTHIPNLHVHLLAHDYGELATHIDALRHTTRHLSLRSHVIGDSIFVAAIPKLRGEKMYVTMPLVSKDVKGRIHFQESHLSSILKKEAHEMVQDVAQILFPKNATIFMLRIHGKRGAFIHGTSPMYFFMLHNQDFLFELASTHGINVGILFSLALEK